MDALDAVEQVAPLRRNIQIRMQSLMDLKSLLKLLQTSSYSRHPGVITNTITQRSFCLHAHQMERCVSFLHYNVGSISDVQLTTQQLTTQLKKRYPDNGR